jgi:hypothetical protein
MLKRQHVCEKYCLMIHEQNQDAVRLHTHGNISRRLMDDPTQELKFKQEFANLTR